MRNETSNLLFNTLKGFSLALIPLLIIILFVPGDKHVGEMAELCRVLLGRPGEIIAKVSSIIVLLGANIIYYVLMSNFLYYSVTFIYREYLLFL